MLVLVTWRLPFIITVEEGTLEGAIMTPCKLRTTCRLRKPKESGDDAWVEFGNIRIPGLAQLLAPELIEMYNAAEETAAQSSKK